MKAIKTILVLLGAFSIFLGGIVLLLFTPLIQKTVALAALEGRMDGSLVIEKMHLLPGSLTLKGLIYSEEEIEIAAKEARIEFSLGQLLREREIKISTIDVSGFVMDASGIWNKTPQETPPPAIDQFPHRDLSKVVVRPKEIIFPGILHYTDTGYGIQVDRISVEGKITLPASREMEFFLKGGDVKPGASAALRLQGSLIDKNPEAPVSRMNFNGDMILTQDHKSGLSQFQFVSTAYARGTVFEGEIALRNEVSVGKSKTGGESHSLQLAVIDSIGGEEVIFDLTDEYSPRESLFRGRFSLNSSSDQLKPFAMGVPLPDFTSEGSGTFEYSLTGGIRALRTAIDGRVDGLENVRRQLSEVPPLAVHSEIDIEQQGSSIWINKLMVEVDNTLDGKMVANLASSGPFRINPGDADMGFEEAEGDLLTLTLDDMPADWFTHLITDADENLYGGSLFGKVALIKEKSDLQVLMTEPLEITGISYSKRGKEFFQNIDVFIRGNLGLSESELRFTLNSIEVRSGMAQLLEGKVEGYINLNDEGPERLQLEGRLTARLNEFYEQPMAEGMTFSSSSVLTLEQSFGIVFGKEFLRFENLDGKLTNDAGKIFFQEYLLKPVSLRLPLEENFITAVELSGDLLQFELSEFPLELIASHIPDYRLSGEIISGEFTLGSVDGYIELRPGAALLMKDINLEDNGGQLLDNFSLSLVPKVFFNHNKLNLFWTDLVARSGQSPAMTGDGNVTLNFNRKTLIEKTSIDLQADIANLARQPFFSKITIADSGLIGLSGSFNLSDRQEFSGQILMKNLQATRAPEIQIKRSTFSIDGILAAGGIQLKAPFTLQGNGGDSDVLLSLLLEQQSQEEGARFIFSAEGKNLVLADMISMAGLLEPVEESAQPTEKTKPSRTSIAPIQRRDEKPFWNGYTGEANLDFGRVVCPGMGQLEKVKAKFRASPSQLFFETVKSGSSGNPLNLNGRIDFNASKSKPYFLQAQVGLSDFDVGSFLRQSAPLQLPMVEGVFNLTGNLRGEAANLDRLLQTAEGELNLENQSGGIFRALPLGGQKSQVASLALTGLDLFAGDKVRQFNTANRVANLLREVEFEEMRIKATRGSNLNIDLTDLWVRGPEILIAGTGRVTNQEGISLLEQPLNLKAQMAAKNEAAYLLNELGHLEDRKTEDGYYFGPAFAIKGTLGNPDKSELDRLLQSTTLGFLGVGGRKVDLDGPDQSEESTQPETQTAPSRGNFQREQAPTKEEEILRSIFQIITDG